MTELLVVDDDPMMLRMLAAALRGGPWRATLVSDAQEAIRLARTQRWDGLITDLDLPGGDGLDLAGLVRQADPGIPVAVITAVNDPPPAGGPGGPDLVLRKPLDRQALLDFLKARLGER